MKGLREYLEEVTRLDEARRKVEVISDSEKSRRALYDLKRQLDSIDQLTGFKYVGRRGMDPAQATFQIRDREQFDRMMEDIQKKHSVQLFLKEQLKE